jgi:hypothetical protein
LKDTVRSQYSYFKLLLHTYTGNYFFNSAGIHHEPRPKSLCYGYNYRK